MRQHPLKLCLVLVVLLMLTLTIQPVQAGTNWKHFSANLEQALKTPNLGLQQSAMRLVIKYGDKLNVENAMTDVMNLYRHTRNEQTRELALLTIYRMNHKKAIELLEEREEVDYNSVFKEKIDNFLSVN